MGAHDLIAKIVSDLLIDERKMPQVVIERDHSIKLARLCIPRDIVEKTAYVAKAHIVKEGKLLCDHLQAIAADERQRGTHRKIHP